MSREINDNVTVEPTSPTVQEEGTGGPDWIGDGSSVPTTFEATSETVQEEGTGEPDAPGDELRGR